MKVLMYDGQGFWLCHKRLSEGRFRWWPAGGDQHAEALAAHQLQVLLCAGDPESTKAARIGARGAGMIDRGRSFSPCFRLVLRPSAIS